MKKPGIIHIEFQVAEREAFSQFLQDLFGWELNYYPDQHYTTFDPGAISGGVNTVEDVLGSPGQTLIYVQSDDIDADLLRAENLGGEIVVPRTALPGMGWFGIFADPSGNQIGLLHFTA